MFSPGPAGRGGGGGEGVGGGPGWGGEPQSNLAPAVPPKSPLNLAQVCEESSRWEGVRGALGTSPPLEAAGER